MPDASPLRIIPHLLTFLRIPLGVAFLLAYDPSRIDRVLLAGVCLVASAASDALDGLLARRMGTVSAFGKWADPLTDALFFLLAYLAFHRAGTMPAVLVAIFVAREVTQYALIRPLTVRSGKDPGARPAGKVKTGAQILGTFAVLVLSGLAAQGILPLDALVTASTIVLSVLVAISAVSLYWYVRPLLRE